ncbi:MAG: class I SAM-dependent methyltransferase [Terracidiphilus sp.]|jgi:ubiquinone/menaquinone biosynthesis C-methylase UbiE
MPTNVRSSRWSQIVAWIVASLFVLGFFYSPVGEWTGPILGVWFAGTQKPRRGFLWMMAFSFIPHLVGDWRLFMHAGPERALEYVAWILLATLLAVMPFTFHRLVSPRLPGLISTLPFPMASAAIQLWSLPFLPSKASSFLANDGAANLPILRAVRAVIEGPIIPYLDARIFICCWFASMVVWMWNHEFRAARIGKGAAFFGVLFGLSIGFEIYGRIRAINLLDIAPFEVFSAWELIPPAGVIVLAIWALANRGKRKLWASRPEAVARLQSPFTGNPLHVVTEQGREALAGSSGERFPIRDGIPAFLMPEDLTGDNGKYNHLYQVIGGFYDDIQRVFIALKGFNRNAYFQSYMSLLEVKTGDSVLETSVGTGLNYKYLPRGVQLSGLDLSPEMLANCQANLRRWQMDADLYLGNAESLPFTDESFDVVFHVGGINFFNDRAKAIREMIRVAKPGSLLLIADETEKHVKGVYEKGPGGHLYKNRKEPVSAPVDLIPPEMQEIHLEIGRTGEWYMLTFRKPAGGK